LTKYHSATPVRHSIKSKIDFMNFIRKTFSLLTLLTFLSLIQVSAQNGNIEPVERFAGKLQISIDPRMELLATIQLISN